MRYKKSNEEIELYCVPFAEKFVEDLVNEMFKYKFRHIPNKDLGASETTNGVLLWLQFNHIDIVVDYADYASALFDMKGTLGIKDKETEEIVFPGYYKLTMEMYYKFENNSNIYKSWPFIKRDVKDNTTFTPKQQYVLYISELMAILIPKVGLEKVMKSPQFKSKFDTTGVPWELNYSDDLGEKYVQNIVFDLRDDRDLDVLLAAGARFYRLVDGVYTFYNPYKIKPYQIKKEYENRHSKSF